MVPSVANLSERKNTEGMFGPKTVELTTGSVLAHGVTMRVLLKALFFLFLVQQPPLGQSLLINEVSRSHTTTHHSR